VKIRCDYCNNYIKDTDEKCPYCGSINAHLVRTGEGVPKTIEELKDFCYTKKMPLEKMRFFIGTDCKEAKAFGIYKDDNDNFIVYKNKSDGSRMIRYQGKDEAYAVNEIYQKLRNEVIDRKESGNITPARKSSPKRPKSNNIQRTHTSSVNRGSGSTLGTGPRASYRNKRIWENAGITVFWIVVVILAITLVKGCADLFDRTPNAGYYQYNGEDYYNDYSKWYSYDDDSGWGSSWYDDDDDSGWGWYDDDNSWGSSWDDDWDSGWDDDDWDYDYSGWDNDYDWDSDW